MKKLIIALVLVAGVSTLVYQSTQNAKLSNAERNQARVLVAAGPSGGDTSTADYVGGPSIKDTSTKPAKPGCQSSIACNFDPEATENGGTCNYAFYTLSTDSDELFTWWKQLTAKIEQEGKLSKTNQASVLAAIDPPGVNPPPVPPQGLSDRLYERNGRKNSLIDPEINIKPIKKCLAGTKCQLVSIVTWNAPASEIAPLSNITFTPFGYVAKKDDRRDPVDIKDIEGKKACRQIAAPKKPATPVNKKTPPANSKVKR